MYISEYGVGKVKLLTKWSGRLEKTQNLVVFCVNTIY